ncbi:lipopolysaccharide biosynthesis protein [Pseudoalteromonas piscicida]|nr:MATE family efflux transporter [Pseudoalteromonas piscicida]
MSILSSILVARTAPIEDAGVYFLFLNYVILFGVVFSLGFHILLVKRFANTLSNITQLDYLKKAIFLISLGPLFLIYTNELLSFPANILPSLQNTRMMSLAIFTGFIWAIVSSLSGAALGLGKPNFSTICQNMIPYTGVCLISVLFMLRGEMLVLNELIALLVIGGIASVLVLGIFHFKNTRKAKMEENRAPVDFTGSGFFWLSSLLQAFLFSGTIIYCSNFLDAKDIAGLYTAQRITAAVSFVMIVINLIAQPVFSRLYHEGKVEDLKAAVKKFTLYPALISFPFIVLIYTFNVEIMGVINASYSEYSNLLSVLLLGYFLALICGPVIPLLQMTGNEKKQTIVNVALLFPVFLNSTLLTKNFGVTGLAWGLTLLLLFQNVPLVILIKKRLGFIPIIGR